LLIILHFFPYKKFKVNIFENLNLIYKYLAASSASLRASSSSSFLFSAFCSDPLTLIRLFWIGSTPLPPFLADELNPSIKAALDSISLEVNIEVFSSRSARVQLKCFIFCTLKLQQAFLEAVQFVHLYP
jgi:hypothetical protein